MKIIMILFFMISISFAGNVELGGCFKLLPDINYRNGTELAHFQDSVFNDYLHGKIPDKYEIRKMKRNWWIRSTKHLNKGNFPVRHYALIDLFENEPNNKKTLIRLVDAVSYSDFSYIDTSNIFQSILYKGEVYDDMRIWAEGYSYWLYTKKILKKWADVFKDVDMQKRIIQIDAGFIATSYRGKDGKFYPAPFGDLWPYNTIEEEYQSNCYEFWSKEKRNCQIVTVEYNRPDTLIYRIFPEPVSLNVHVPKDNSVIYVIDGEVQNFKWYEGYSKKYKNKRAEWTDILSPVRIISTIFIR